MARYRRRQSGQKSQRPWVPIPDAVEYQALDAEFPRVEGSRILIPDPPGKGGTEWVPLGVAHSLLAQAGREGSLVRWPALDLPYPVAPPERLPVVEPEPPRERAPEPQKEDFQPAKKWTDWIFPQDYDRKRLAADLEFDAAQSNWREWERERQGERREFEAKTRYNQEAAEDFEKALRSWEAAKEAWESAARAERERLAPLKTAYFGGEPDAIRAFALLVLSRSQWPSAFPREASAEYDAKIRTLLVSLRLPDFTRITVDKGAFKAASKRDSERVRRETLYALCLRTLYELAASDEARAFERIACNGWVRFVDGATGHERSEVVLSVLASAEEVRSLNIGDVEPEAAFRALKGIAAPRLDVQLAITPILTFDKSDRRLIEGREVMAGLEAQQNLAAMDWEDFEHLIRELFEREWSEGGAEVRVTQASRDRGVDAIAFDPDPLRGGKFVIQAKRYTRVVDVSAVRDLWGTVMNEGASRGILVTTSSYGPEAHQFAAGKPLTLLTGVDLLRLFEKHGYTFKIDLAEARELNREHGR